MDILICKMIYPNDPTKKLKPHMHFVGYYENNVLEMYSISSIAGKEYKVYDTEGKLNPKYYLINGNDFILCNLQVPSFIDCSKAYQLNITKDMDINKLKIKNIPKQIKENIKNKINELKNNGEHIQYTIKSSEFIIYNPKCYISNQKDSNDSSFYR